MSYQSELVDFIESRDIDLSGLNVLDIGAGAGNVAEELKARGANVYAVDKEPRWIQEGIRAGVYTEETAKPCRGGDLAKGNPFDKKFDLVICSGTAQYMSPDERRDMIHGVRRHCLADGGSFLFHVPNTTRAQAYENELAAGQDMIKLSQKMAAVTNYGEQRKFKKEVKALHEDGKEQLKTINAVLGKYFGDVSAHNLGEAVFMASSPKQLGQCPQSNTSKALSIASLKKAVRNNRLEIQESEFNVMGDPKAKELLRR